MRPPARRWSRGRATGGEPRTAAHDRRDLERVLDRVRQPVDAGCDDVVDRGRHLDVGGGEPHLAVLDDDAAGLPELPEDLLDVEGVALAPRREAGRGTAARAPPPGGASGPSPDVVPAQTTDRDRLRERRAEPVHRVLRPRAQEEEERVPRKARARCCRNSSELELHPVHVLDHEDDGPGSARSEEHRPEDVEGPRLELGTGQAWRNDSGDREAQEVGEHRGGSSPSIPSAPSRSRRGRTSSRGHARRPGPGTAARAPGSGGRGWRRPYATQVASSSRRPVPRGHAGTRTGDGTSQRQARP